jgi:hypothetical protein
MRRTAAVLIGILFAALTGACVQSDPTAPAAAAFQSNNSMRGAAGQMPALYDGQQFTVNMMELPNSEALVANMSVNEIYTTKDLDEEQDFLPVLDAIQGDGFNPLWEQFRIVFNAGFTPRQFMSDTEVNDATLGPNPEITLVDTHEVYRCSVVGTKH